MAVPTLAADGAQLARNVAQKPNARTLRIRHTDMLNACSKATRNCFEIGLHAPLKTNR